jgi:hypothetical protein
MKNDTPYSRKDLDELKETFIILKDSGLNPLDINKWFNLQVSLISLSYQSSGKSSVCISTAKIDVLESID